VKSFVEVIGLIACGLLAFAVLIGIAWGVQGNDFFMYRVFAPKYESARRETFEQSKAFNQGMIQELQDMQFEYVKASPEHKDALASIILHRAADYDEAKLPADLRSFVSGLRRERNFTGDLK
jgi:hypothetical protein